MLYAVTCTCELTGRRGGDFEFVLSEIMQLEAGEERCREFPLGSVARCGDGVDSRLSGQDCRCVEPVRRGSCVPCARINGTCESDTCASGV